MFGRRGLRAVSLAVDRRAGRRQVQVTEELRRWLERFSLDGLGRWPARSGRPGECERHIQLNARRLAFVIWQEYLAGAVVRPEEMQPSCDLLENIRPAGFRQGRPRPAAEGADRSPSRALRRVATGGRRAAPPSHRAAQKWGVPRYRVFRIPVTSKTEPAPMPSPTVKVHVTSVRVF